MKFIALVGAVVLFLSFRVYIERNDYDTEKLNVSYNTGTVVGIGQCYKSECSYTLKTSEGFEQVSTTSDPVSVGQIVYQQCWTERVKGARCYVDYSPSKRG